MVESELCVHLLTYNLIRLPMAQSAADHALVPRAPSFKHTVQFYSQHLARRQIKRLGYLPNPARVK
jgi:hypothetical protein